MVEVPFGNRTLILNDQANKNIVVEIKKQEIQKAETAQNLLHKYSEIIKKLVAKVQNFTLETSGEDGKTTLETSVFFSTPVRKQNLKS